LRKYSISKVLMMILNKLKVRISNFLKNFNQINKNSNIHKTAKICRSYINAKSNIGANSNIKDSRLNGTIAVGRKSSIDTSTINGNIKTNDNCKLYCCTLSGNIEIGKFSSLWGPNLDIITKDQKVIIGNFCSIARNVSIQTYNHNYKKPTTYLIGQNIFNEKWGNEFPSKGDIIIMNDVWIGSHSVIINGVTIHNGSIVAANSVVTKDVPPYAIVAGSPAKIIGYRFDEEKIKYLENLSWWDWSLEKIKENKSFFGVEFEQIKK